MRQGGQSAQSQMPGNVPSSAIGKGRGGSLATIKERDEAIRSADPNYSKSRHMAVGAQINHVRNQPSGYNNGAGEQAGRRLQNIRSNIEVGQHRSPVIPAGKENTLMLPPIDIGR